MNKLPLQLIFEDIKKNNIIINLEDDTYCHTLSQPDGKYTIPEKIIAYIYSSSDINQIINDLLEEGSSIITYSYMLKPVIKEDIFKKIILADM